MFEQTENVMHHLRDAESMPQAMLEQNQAEPLDYTMSLVLITNLAKVALHPAISVVAPDLDRVLGSCARVLARHAASLPEEQRKIDEALAAKVFAKAPEPNAKNN